jgi:hypothetical protein
MEVKSQLGPEYSTNPCPVVERTSRKLPCFMDRSRDRRLATIGKYPSVLIQHATPCILNSFEERAPCHALHIEQTMVRTFAPTGKLTVRRSGE